MSQQISLRQALIHANGRITQEAYEAYWRGHIASVTTFTDGSALIAQSEHDEEEFPGSGTAPPSFYLLCDRDPIPENPYKNFGAGEE